MLGSLLIAALLAFDQKSPSGQVESHNDAPIVVTGNRIRDLERELRECLARACPPNEDIDATLALAEAQFIAGEYRRARSTIRESLGRNRGHAASYPVPVSDLYRSGATVAVHLGEGEEFKDYTYAILRSLKKGLPDQDPRLLGAQFEIAQMETALKNLPRANRQFDELEERAREAGNADMVAVARLRKIWLQHLAGHSNLARSRLRKLADDRSPANGSARLGALILLARLDLIQGKSGASEELIAALQSAGGEKQNLLFSPPYDEPTQGLSADAKRDGGMTGLMEPMDSFHRQWIDVGFWVTPEGRVNDVQILRQSGSTYWATQLLKSIPRRIYSKLRYPGPGTYRVERYTFTALYDDTKTGSNVRQRAAEGRIEFLDLTEAAPSKQSIRTP